MGEHQAPRPRQPGDVAQAAVGPHEVRAGQQMDAARGRLREREIQQVRGVTGELRDRGDVGVAPARLQAEELERAHLGQHDELRAVRGVEQPAHVADVVVEGGDGPGRHRGRRHPQGSERFGHGRTLCGP